MMPSPPGRSGQPEAVARNIPAKSVNKIIDHVDKRDSRRHVRDLVATGVVCTLAIAVLIFVNNVVTEAISAKEFALVDKIIVGLFLYLGGVGSGFGLKSFHRRAKVGEVGENDRLNSQMSVHSWGREFPAYNQPLPDVG